MQHPCRILIVEDDADQRELFALALQTIADEVVSVEDAEQGLERLRREPFTVALTDWYLPGMMGDEFVRHAREEFPLLLLVLMSSHDHVRDTAHACEADGWFRKNDGVPRLRLLVNAVMSSKEPLA